jgi:CBS domain-containing protein/ribosome-associated translation inhibitor RaiA
MEVFDLKAIELDKLLVGDIMSPPSLVINKGERVSDAISKMRKGKVREVPIIEGDKPIGLVSYSSLLTRRSVPLSAKVEHIMIPCPRLEEDMNVLKAAEELMALGVRGAPVVRNGKIVGFLSRTDIIRVLSGVDQLKGKSVAELMSTNPHTVSEDEPVRKAQIIMTSLNEKTLPVVDDNGKLMGAIGMTDVMDVIWSPKASKPPNEVRGDREPADIRVGSVMTRTPVFVGPKDKVDKAVSSMLKSNLSTGFVADEGKLVGVVSHADIMEQVISLLPRDGVYVQITGLDAEDPEVYELLYEMIEKSMKRIDRFQSPRVFTIHVTTYHQDGMKSKYSIRARLTTDHGMHYAKAADWNLNKGVYSSLEMLERNLRKDHEKKLDKRKRKGNSS